ncbi:MAG: serine protease [Chitinophagaceae bacterium]|nr:serine protease [Chitinophagaceae bacterium]
MFVKAIEKISRFTAPIHIISHAYGGTITPGTSTMFFVNDDGVAVTCKHVAELIMSADAINVAFNKFKIERNAIPRGKKYRAALQGLEARYKLKKNTTVSVKIRFLNVGIFTGITCHTHPALDLAILIFNDLTQKQYNSHATFINDPNKIKQGKSLCRYGFPFPEFNNYKHNDDNDELEWTEEGVKSSPSFPLDGIITRFLGTNELITGIEMSTPGLKGQSGGPLFDEDGLVYGLQYATNHLHLGFDIKNFEITNDQGNKERISDSPFLHVGHCIHVDQIKEFLQDNHITF